MNLIKDHPLTTSTVYRPLPRGKESVPSVLNAGVLTDSPVKELTVVTDIFPMEGQCMQSVRSSAADI